MKHVGTILAALFVAFVLVAYMCTFQVRFTEVAIKKTFGKPAQAAITEPGLCLKWPKPIQSAVVYDKRVRILEKRTEETRTEDGKNVLLATFTLWRIADPHKFDTSFPGGVEDGQKKLRTTIEADVQEVVGRRSFDEFVSTDPNRRKLRQIEQQMLAAVARDVEDEYGVEIVDFGIKKLTLPQSITSEIFGSMKAAEESKAGTYIAEGNAEATQIESAARATEGRILAAAREKVAQIEAEAQRVVSEYYKEFDKHPELRIYLDKLRTIADALRIRTTLILDTEESPWDVFDGAARSRVPWEGTDPEAEAAVLEAESAARSLAEQGD